MLVVSELKLLKASTCDLTGAAWPTAVWRDIMRGTAVQVCDQSKVGDGRCDRTNNMISSNCAMDGGDCCFTTCYANCVTKQLSTTITSGDVPYASPQGGSSECAYMCGLGQSPTGNCPYLCLADDYMGVGTNYTSWCSGDRGTQTPMGSCYGTTGDVVSLLLECLKDEASHGNAMTSNARCGNQTGTCTVSDVTNQVDGCHMHPELCTSGSCCTTAIARGWIDPSVKTLPSECDLYRICVADADCFPTLAECGRTNKACRGGCCMCSNQQWFGPNCDQPLCWPKCKNGLCVAPNACFCDPGWSGESCEIPVCEPTCVGGQGVCVSPDTCECFYGWTGDECETPKSTPPCVNGVAVAPDVCMCDSGWGGRICDYPICQSWPEPTADCGHGVCGKPWTCECEPGWDLTIPVGADGLAITPDHWKGRELISTVSGDTRFNLKRYDQYNAFKCETPANCELTAGPRCRRCDLNGCIECMVGYFVEPVTSKCEYCNLRFPRCRECDSDQCLTCDPLFALVEGKCVSDGIFELSSPVFNALSSDRFVEITVVRAVDSGDSHWLASRPPVSVILQTESDPETVYQSIHAYSDFQRTMKVLEFGQTDVVKKVEIPIFDNLAFDRILKKFEVKLLLDPRGISGSPLPVRPSEGDSAPISTALVNIWDTRLYDPSTCGISYAFISQAVIVSSATGMMEIPVSCLVADELNGGWVNMTASLDPPAWFGTTTILAANTRLPSVLTSTVSAVFNSDGYLGVRASVPNVGQKIQVIVHALLPGIMARQYLLTALPATGQGADVRRLEHNINQTWDTAQDAPPLIVYSGYMHFGCTTIPFASIGISLAQGAYAKVEINEEGVIEEQREAVIGSSDEEWQAGLENVLCDNGGLFCYNSTSWNSDEILRLNVTFKPSMIFFTKPAGIRMMGLNDQGNWGVIPSECLLGGIEVHSAPLRGIEIV